MEKLSTSEVISQKPHGEWKHPPSSAFRVKSKVDVLGSSVSEGFETKNEIHKMVFFLFLSVTLYTLYLLIHHVFYVYFFCSLRYLCYDNDIIVKDGAGQEIQAIALSDFPLRNNPNAVI